MTVFERPPCWLPLAASAEPIPAAEATEDVAAGAAPTIQGYCAPAYSGVLKTFRDNFQRGELGASFTLCRGGERVVDLWGGFRDTERTRPWESDTLAVYFSCSKMAVALVVHHLVATGRVILDEPLSTYWPELAAGQAGGTLRMCLAHTLGLPALSSRLRPGAYLDHDYMADQLSRQRPLWEPGTRVGYHPITFGFLLGEVVRRVTGKTVGHCFREWFAEPLGLDLWIGLPEREFTRTASIVPYRPRRDDIPRHVGLAAREIGSIANLWLFNAGGWTVDVVNTPEGLIPENPAATGVGNARSLAALLALFNDADRLRRLGLGAETLALLQNVSAATHCDATLLTKTRFSLGFMKSMDNRNDPQADNFIVGEAAFGHVGHGGAFGVVDPEAGFAAAYVMNQQGAGILLNPRGQLLIDACYRSVGYAAVQAGAWRR